MRVVDEDGRIIKTQEVVAHLHALVLSDTELSSLVSAVEPDVQDWGATALHFSARLVDSGAPVLLKVNVAEEQLWWTRMLVREYPDLIPCVYATGEHVSGEHLGWILWEKVRGGLHPGWEGREFDMLLEAGVRFQIAARRIAHRAETASMVNELKADTLAMRLEQGVRRAAPGPANQVLDRLDEHWSWVKEICETEVCHGDLHMANALCREEPPGGIALLIDYHPTQMPWAYEPAKPEILNADPSRKGCRGLVAKQAAIRSQMGLSAPVGIELERLQSIVLGWYAIEAWAYIGSSPDQNWRARHIWHAENLAYISAAATA